MSMRSHVVVGVLAAVVALAGPARGQSGVVTGTVYRDSAGHPLSDVEVSLMPVGIRARTNYAGEFRLRSIPDGSYQIVFRHIGFSTLTDTVTVRERQPVDREFTLA